MNFTKKTLPNYGFPFSSIFIRFVVTNLLILISLLLYLISNDLILVAFFFILFILPALIFFVFLFKQQFFRKRLIILNEMINLAKLNGDEKILDLGTGSGFIAIGFAKVITNGIVYGIDRYKIMNNSIKIKILSFLKNNFIGNSLKGAIKNAKLENNKEKCKFIKSNLIGKFAFDDNFFNLIVSCQSLYCIPIKHQKSVLSEINRVLKKGGKIIFYESKSFLNWNIEDVIKYFENLDYEISIIKRKDLEKGCILYGEK